MPQVVFVVDDDSAILDLIRRVCTSFGWHAQTFTRAQAFLEIIRPDTPGCLILDYRLPDLNGLELLKELNKRSIELPVVFISGKAEVSTAVQAFKAGTMDFLEKPFAVEDLRQTIERALASDVSSRANRKEKKRIAERVASLTPREVEVMEHVVSGLANKAIAAELGVSPKTIEVHRANVMQKMVAHSLAELVQMAIAHRG